MTPYYFTRQRHARLTAFAICLGLSVVIGLLWPTESRCVQTLLTSVSEALACDGPVTATQAQSLHRLVQADFSAKTTIAISGPKAINGSFTTDELFRQFTELCADLGRFHVDLSQVSVDLLGSGETAQASADASVEYVLLGRTEREHRQARFTIRREGRAYRIVAAEVTAGVINQPEPRP
jgi:hypothetical protein